MGAVGAAVALPPSREALGLAGWWLTNDQPPEVTLHVPPGVSRGQIVVGVTVGPSPSWRFLDALVDGQPLPPGPEIPIDTRQLKDGEHVLRVAVRDGSLRRNVRWVEATFRSDNTPPQVFLEPRTLVVEQGKTLLLQARTSEPAQVALQRAGASLLSFSEDRGVYVAFLGVDPSLPAGHHPARLVATDEAGNQTVHDLTIEVTRTRFPSEQIVLPAHLLQLLTSGEYDRELNALTEYYSNSGNGKLWEGTFEQPVRGVISSGYGIERTYNSGVARNRHLGTDFDVPVGTPVSATARGKVVLAQPLAVRGNAVIIDHGVGVHSAYYHLARLDVRPGELVNRGQLIGLSGATGMATGPHLHFEIRLAGIAVDPLEWLRARFL
ncbi:MAG: hypothetical protein KatS3mg061_0751 [Dehalococcoidia bacterium]|nr:MAG: hypothetical protein KatS3mg061_0751 [Dehalococcoidia bacterium]